MKKRILSIALCALLLLALAVPAFADDDTGIITVTTTTGTSVTSSPQDGLDLGKNADGSLEYFKDGAGLVLSGSQSAALTQKLKSVSQARGCDFAVVTVLSTGSRTPMEYADDYYDYSGFRTDGAVLLISMAERDWWISTSGRCIQWIDDEYIGKKITSNLSSGNYYEAFDRFADLCSEMAQKGASGKTWRAPMSPVWIVVAVVIGLLVALIGTSSMKGKLKSVRAKAAASDYVRDGSLNVTQASDLFLYSHVSRTARQTESRSGGGGGGVHTSSSGSSHGGSGGKF